MEQCFRIALWMFLLIGYFQAQPVRMDDLNFKLLQRVSCLLQKNLNFTSPTNVQRECQTAALKHFMDELERARVNCNIAQEQWHIGQTLEALEMFSSNKILTQCNFTMTVHEQFGKFVKATESFAQQLNDSQ